MMKPSTLKPLVLSGALLTCVAQAWAQIPFTGTPYTQNFDGLPTAEVADVTSATIGAQAAIPNITGWSGTKVFGSGSTLQPLRYTNGTGTSGGLYNYGPTGSTERALGAIGSGSNAMAFGAEFINQTGGTITSVTISFTAEFWRSSTSTKNVLIFAYGYQDGTTVTAANYLTASAATAVPNLNVTGPDPVASPNAELDGNVAPNRTAVSTTINGLSWAPGTVLFIRWTDKDDVGSDAGLAVDDLTLSGVVSSGGDISRGAGTTFTPTSFGGNAFTSADNAVFDGSATAVSVSGQVIAYALKFLTDGYSVTGTPADSLAVEGTVFVDTGMTASISAILTGDDGLIKTGAGTLALSGANTFTGAVSISAGRLTIGADSALGALGNDVTVNGALQITATPFTLGADRTLGGAGTIEAPAGGSLTLAGPVTTEGSLTFTGPQTLVFGGASNTLASLVLSQATNVHITGGSLQPSTGITIDQTGGTSVITGAIAFGASGDRTVAVPAGTLELDGNVSLGGRLIKTGAGTLDLTGTALSGTTAANGGIRLGVVGNTSAEGGLLVIDEATDLGNLQMHFNSGTLNATLPIVSATGVSIGGRRGGVVGPVTFTGAEMTFNGASGFFNATGGGGELGFNVDNTTTLNGTIPVVASAGPIGYLNFGGSGTFIIGGNASALTDNFDVKDSLTFVMNGSFGGKIILIGSTATLAGSGTFTGTPIAESIAENRINISGLLTPTGLLTFHSALTLESGSATVLTIGGTTRGAGYDSVTVTTPVSDGSINYTATYGGALELNFTASAVSGDYTLFELGQYVNRAGAFTSVTVSGSHVGELDPSGTVWSKTIGAATFSFDEATGVLTVTGGASPTTALEDWRALNFDGVTTNTGDAADDADPDGDGIPNLVEYATGTSPTSANAGVITVATASGGEFLTLSFPRIADPSITYTVLATSDLATAFTSVASYTGTAADVVTYQDTVSLNTAGVKRFLRLRVSYAAE